MSPQSHALVLAFVLLAVPVAAGSPLAQSAGSETQSVMLDVSTQADVGGAHLPVSPPVGSIAVEQELALPYVSSPVDLGTRANTSAVAGEGPVGADPYVMGPSYVWTPVTKGYVWSPLPAFLFEGDDVNLSFAFLEGTVDLNEGFADDVRIADEGITFMTAPYTPEETHGVQHPIFEAAADALVEAPHVGYHINTRHLAARVSLENDFIDARSSFDGEFTRAPRAPLTARVPAPLPTAAMPEDPRPAPVPRLPVTDARETLAAPTITPLRTLGVGVDATGMSPTTALLVGAAAAVAVVLVGLYSLFQSKDVLKSEIRRKIYNTIAENPGITIVHLADSIGVRHQTVCYHLQLLKKGGYVTAHQKGNKVLHFVNGAGLNDAHRELLVVDPDSVTMRVLQGVLRTPGIIKKDVAAATGLTRTGGAWHVNKLVKLGLVREEKKHGHCRLYPVEERVELLFRLRTEVESAELPVATDVPVQVPAPTPPDAPGFTHPM